MEYIQLRFGPLIPVKNLKSLFFCVATKIYFEEIR